MGETFSEAHSNQFANPSQTLVSPGGDSAPPGFCQDQLSFEDILRTQDEVGITHDGGTRPPTELNRFREDVEQRGMRSYGDAVGPTGYAFASRNDVGGGQKFDSEEESFIAQLQRHRMEQRELEQRSQANLELQQRARFTLNQHQQQQQSHSALGTDGSFRQRDDLPHGASDDFGSYLSESDQQELLHYLQTSGAGPSNMVPPPPLPPASAGAPDNFGSYRTSHSHSHSGSVSPQPSPAFLTTTSPFFEAHHLASDPLVLDSVHGSSSAHARETLGTGWTRAHARSRSSGGASVSSYAASSHPREGVDLDGLEDQFATRLGGSTGGVADMYGPSTGDQFAMDPPPGPVYSASSGIMKPPNRGWSEDDHGAAAAMARWRETLKSQADMDAGPSSNTPSRSTVGGMLLVNEPASYEDDSSTTRYAAHPPPPSGPMGPSANTTLSQLAMSEFAKRMNSEASDKTMDSYDSIDSMDDLRRNEQQRQHITTMNVQIQSGWDQNGFALPPLPAGPDPMAPFPVWPAAHSNAQANHGSAKATGGGPVRHDSLPTENRPHPASTLSNSPHFRPGGQFSQTKPHSPPALIIPDDTHPSPHVQPAQVPYPHQRINDPGPSRLRQHHHPQASDDLSTRGLQTQASDAPPQNKMFLGIPSGGNVTMKDTYLSPIGPGGPSINIVPSTPISGLKDGKGIWDKMAIQAQQQQQQQQQQQHGQGPLPTSAQVKQEQEMTFPHHSLFTVPVDKNVRRASHSGNYIQHAPSHLELQGRVSNSFEYELATAAATGFITSDRGGALSAPAPRQRSRSEGQMQKMLSQFDPNLFKAFSGGSGNGSSDDALSVSNQSSYSGVGTEQGFSTSSVDPKMVMAAAFGPVSAAHPQDACQHQAPLRDVSMVTSDFNAGLHDWSGRGAMMDAQGGVGGGRPVAITAPSSPWNSHLMLGDDDHHHHQHHHSPWDQGLQAVNTHHHLGDYNASRRGRSVVRGGGHIRAVKSEDFTRSLTQSGEECRVK